MSYMLILLFPFPRHPFIATEGFSSPHHLNPLPQELVIFCRCWTQHVSFWRHLCSGHSSQWSLCINLMCRLQKWSRHPCFRVSTDIPSPYTASELPVPYVHACHPSAEPHGPWAWAAVAFFFYVLTSLGKALGNTVPKWIWVLPHCFSHFNLSQYYEAYWILSNWSLFAFILFFSFSLEGGVWNLNL